MTSRPLFAAMLAALALTAASPANAGSPWYCVPACVVPVAVAPMVVYRPYELPRVYIVNQGPVFSGPGIYTRPEVVVPPPMGAYPYVGSDYPVYRDVSYRRRYVRAAPRRVLRAPPGWWDK